MLFLDVTARESRFGGSTYHKAVFSGSNLENAKFDAADLSDADLRNVIVDKKTSFSDVTFTGTKIDRFTLDCLGDDRGGLTNGQLAVAAIEDDVARLREEFGGFWALLHATFLIIFASPYAWFIANHWSRAKFTESSEDSIPLLFALFNYIVSGGVKWQSFSPSWMLSVFLIYLIYNAARFALLYKTKRLETRQAVTGIPIQFSFQDKKDVIWLWCFRACKIGFWFSFLLVAWNTTWFLMMRIPLE